MFWEFSFHGYMGGVGLSLGGRDMAVPSSRARRWEEGTKPEFALEFPPANGDSDAFRCFGFSGSGLKAVLASSFLPRPTKICKARIECDSFVVPVAFALRSDFISAAVSGSAFPFLTGCCHDCCAARAVCRGGAQQDAIPSSGRLGFMCVRAQSLIP